MQVSVDGHLWQVSVAGVASVAGVCRCALTETTGRCPLTLQTSLHFAAGELDSAGWLAASTYHQPSEWEQIAFFNPLDLYWSSLESGDLWYKSSG